MGLAGLGLLRGAVAARPFTSARLAALGAALGVAAAWVAWMGQTDPASRAVELVHFLEYRLITAAVHRVWRDRDPVTAVALPGLSAGLAGVAEEWWQWFLPARVGEIKDMALDPVAIGCALVVLRAFAPPPAGHAPRAAWAPARRLAAVVVVALAAFVHTVHLGVRVVDGPRAFDSRFTPAELDRAAAARARAWAGAPPLVRPDRLSREDQYATEGLQHVQARKPGVGRGRCRHGLAREPGARAILRAGARHAVVRLEDRPPLESRATRRGRRARRRRHRRAICERGLSLSALAPAGAGRLGIRRHRRPRAVAVARRAPRRQPLSRLASQASSVSIPSTRRS